MSVAFRRESDEEHKEPRFELPLPAGPNMVTARGPALIAAKVVEIEAAIETETVEEARELLKRELRYWHTRQSTAEIAPVPEEDVVGIGSRVRIRLAGRERVIDIVGHDEADPAADRIAFQAPLAKALIGAEAGELVDFNGKAEAIEILATEAIPG
ncbi:GreA/GreB family elongation factor [Sphingomonas sp. G-3-2-10]|uniref:GreA/GreB family elongation factor n=1 Tax=Sphingomonas sp. G-3-2-10 TaxID=2728838 RepID=UPI00146F8AA0|nr:GreA/GreB family elongation factor [Sphingomonas sp. G-3-2-10]NML08239.1 nucleoside-diphosphate kinase [Sphingomonas sp. G-3-2-10]